MKILHGKLSTFYFLFKICNKGLTVWHPVLSCQVSHPLSLSWNFSVLSYFSCKLSPCFPFLQKGKHKKQGSQALCTCHLSKDKIFWLVALSVYILINGCVANGGWVLKNLGTETPHKPALPPTSSTHHTERWVQWKKPLRREGKY